MSNPQEKQPGSFKQMDQNVAANATNAPEKKPADGKTPASPEAKSSPENKPAADDKSAAATPEKKSA